MSHHVGAQVDAEDGDGAQGQGDVGDNEEEEGRDLGDVAGQGVGDGLLEIVEDQTTCRRDGAVSQLGKECVMRRNYKSRDKFTNQTPN